MTASEGVEITGPDGDRYDEILTPGALGLIASLEREFGPRRAELLAARAARQEELSAGGMLDFLPGTQQIRQDTAWRVAPPAPGLVDRRVEITGPTERKMTINALNSGANVWLADFEDANTPLWENMIIGQLNLLDALDRTIDFTSEEGKSYRLRPGSPMLGAGPRLTQVAVSGWSRVHSAISSLCAHQTSSCTRNLVRIRSETRTREAKASAVSPGRALEWSAAGSSFMLPGASPGSSQHGSCQIVVGIDDQQGCAVRGTGGRSYVLFPGGT